MQTFVVYFSAKDAKDAKYGGSLLLPAVMDKHCSKPVISSWIN